MKQKKLLFVGYGDIATRASRLFLADDCGVTGIARRERRPPAGVDIWQGAVTDDHILQQLARQAFDVAVITLTPTGRELADYARTYLDTSERLVNLWQTAAAKPGLIIFVSSTSVYHQDTGEWVDESSPTQPASSSGEILLAAESLWRDSTLNSCTLRFSGIYGPGRNHLLEQVTMGQGGPRQDAPYTNRIHVDDCVGIIHHLCHRHWAGQQLESLYLASDKMPVTSWEIRQWLADQIGYPPDHLQESPASGRGGNKRCNNARLLATGYEFKYPDFRAGYADLLNTGD